MNQNAEMLNFIYQNTQMGVTTLNQLIEIVDNVDMNKQLEKQRKEYKTIHEKAKDMLHENGYDEQSISMFETMSAYIMINMKTLTDKSVSHIAEMLVQGSNMGIIDATKKIKEYEKIAEKDIVDLMKKLLEIEEENAEKLKMYL
ncbi:MAG: hypothetical protein RR275_05065 [Lachnospiraceae bacterium]